MQAHATTRHLGSPRARHEENSQRGRIKGRSYGKLLQGGIAAAFLCGIVAASSAQASDEFTQGFEDQLGRSVARHLVHAVFDAHRPHAVRYVPSFYFDEHRRHHHARHPYEPQHRRLDSRRRGHHAHHRGCGHLELEVRHRDRHANAYREHYVEHSGRHDRRGERYRQSDGPRGDDRRWDRHS